jgi:hypothetical protein
MQILGWWFYVGLLAAAAGIIALLAWLAGSILEEFYSLKLRKEFEADLLSAIKTTQPPLSQILAIARTRHTKNSVVYGTLQRMLRELLTGREKDLLPHRQLIEQYIAKMDEAEPFEGMPSQVRIHLERIRENLPAQSALLDPLITQIRELLSVNESERKRQRYYTIGGFLVGLLGLFFAAIAYFYPYSGSPTASQPPAAPVSVGAPDSLQRTTPNP